MTSHTAGGRQIDVSHRVPNIPGAALELGVSGALHLCMQYLATRPEMASSRRHEGRKDKGDPHIQKIEEESDAEVGIDPRDDRPSVWPPQPRNPSHIIIASITPRFVLQNPFYSRLVSSHSTRSGTYAYACCNEIRKCRSFSPSNIPSLCTFRLETIPYLKKKKSHPQAIPPKTIAVVHLPLSTIDVPFVPFHV